MHTECATAWHLVLSTASLPLFRIHIHTYISSKTISFSLFIFLHPPPHMQLHVQYVHTNLFLFHNTTSHLKLSHSPHLYTHSPSHHILHDHERNESALPRPLGATPAPVIVQPTQQDKHLPHINTGGNTCVHTLYIHVISNEHLHENIRNRLSVKDVEL